MIQTLKFLLNLSVLAFLLALPARAEPGQAGQGEPAAWFTTGGSGLTMRSENYSLRIAGDFQLDHRAFLGVASGPDDTLVRRLRPTLSGTVHKYVDYYFRPDFAGGTASLSDAYVEVKYFSRAKLRVGKFKPPIGLERLNPDDDTNFAERGLPTLLVPSRDIGFQISGDLVKRRLAYAAGVFRGVANNAASDPTGASQRDYAARLYLTPFVSGNPSPLSGLGFGIGGSTGGTDGIALASYRSFGQRAFLPFEAGVAATGHRIRLAPQASYYLGPLGVLAEFTVTKESLRKEAVQESVPFRSWQIQAAYILTGESKSALTPAVRKPFDPRHARWGALEIAARVGHFRAGREIYEYGFANPADAARAAHEWVGGLNWYLSRQVRITLDYGKTTFTGGAVGGDRRPERVLISRFQINFI